MNLKWVKCEINAAYFSKHLQGDQVYIYKADAHFTLIEGYPKTVKEELGIEGTVDAAFVCPTENIAHIIQGKMSKYLFLMSCFEL